MDLTKNFYKENETDIERRPIVIENGTATTRAGFAGEEIPKVHFSTVIGKPRRTGGCMIGIGGKSSYIGEEAKKSSRISINYPVRNGIISNYTDLEQIWFDIFYNELGVDPEHHSVLFVESPFNIDSSRAQTAQIMFERFLVPNFLTKNSAFLALFSIGKKSGFVVDSGESFTSFVPIFNEKILTHNLSKVGFAGKKLNGHFSQLLTKKKRNFRLLASKESIINIKENDCYVAFDYEEEMQINSKMKFMKKFLVGNKEYSFKLGSELFEMSEVFFDPKMQKFHQSTIQKCACDIILDCEEKVQKELFSNILLIGGSSLIRGFDERLQKEICKIADDNFEVNVIAPSERKHLAWIGGSKFASIPDFEKNCISREEYLEKGEQIFYQEDY
ncbi:actin-10-related [Anaeramoeba ignava]|uniref:Actin-10-related n=1 Tax=Anaeramoeba ignava TaxID=1746090 RepID=A0A9Q0LQ73_ANAIG|nr:actin-10-related [Anaeramoeba ignava]